SCPAGRSARCMRARSTLRSRHPGQPMTKADQPPKPERDAAPERIAAFQTGLSAESRCAAWLIAKGYRIVARRFRSRVGEIDIIARRRGVTAFIEVKARATLEDAAYAIT